MGLTMPQLRVTIGEDDGERLAKKGEEPYQRV